ncbi:MAG: cob(I)yrinic acid a,c-diamide adenosyltransferase [Treponema sp.]|nr:cob(I)yrinic acid a,c-diamide adenosyltransferase [Treponema sp.]
MLHLYYGEGKGKTTASLGLAIRAAGNGWRVIFVQFLKNTPVGEITSLEKLGATVLRGKAGNHFFSQMTEQEKTESKAISDTNFSRALALCKEYPESSQILLVLDEICAAYQYELIDRDAVDALVSNPPANVELVLTGRNPPALFLEKADYITEMKKIRHPFDNGLVARRGVEF